MPFFFGCTDVVFLIAAVAVGLVSAMMQLILGLKTKVLKFDKTIVQKIFFKNSSIVKISFQL